MTTDKSRFRRILFRTGLQEPPRRTTLLAAGAALASLLAYVLIRHLAQVSMIDAIVYRAEGSAVLHGEDLYALRVIDGTASLPATYPPFAALLFTPTALLSVHALRFTVTAINLVLLGVVAFLSCRLVGWPSRPLRPAAVLLVAGFSVWLEPVWTTLRYGQINLAILALVLYDLGLPDSRRHKGVALGIAAGLKITPGFFVVYLLLTRRFRAAGAAALAGLGTVLVALPLLPNATWNFWTSALYDTTRVGKEYIVDNQSLRGGVDRVLHSTHAGLSVVVLVGLAAVVGLGAAVLIDRRCGAMPRARAWSTVTVGITMVLVSPISWTHHWVWCVPLLVLLGAEVSAERRRGVPGWRGRRWRVAAAGTAFTFLSFAMWIVPHKAWHTVDLKPVYLPLASVYPVFGLVFLGFVALRVRRNLARAGGGAPRLVASSVGESGDATRPRASARG